LIEKRREGGKEKEKWRKRKGECMGVL